MATIRASWKRTVQVKPYESETLELAVEQDNILADVPAERLVAAAQDLDRTLAAAGDILILERLNLRVTEATPEPKGVDFSKARRPANRQDPAPDPKVIAVVKKGETPVENAVEPDDADAYLAAQ